MILGLYKKMVELKWSGWRETNSHLTTNSQIDIIFYNFNKLNMKSNVITNSQTCDKRTKKSFKLGLLQNAVSLNKKYIKLIPILLQLNKFDNHSTV